MPKISVIIPVYNTAEYLQRCLESVLNQTLSDIEVICVNDCSPDNSLEILNSYAKKDERLKIIDFQENKGVSIARNTAIQQAQGEYIGFVDSDDFVDLDFYEKLYNKAEQTQAEVVKGCILEIEKPKEQDMFDELQENIYKNRAYFHCMFTTAIYKKTLLDKYSISFPENLILGEDRLLPVKASFLANKLELVAGVFYYYTVRNDSATSDELNSQKINSLIILSKLVFEFINQLSVKIEDYKIITEEFLINLIIIISEVKIIQNINFNLLQQIYNMLRYKKELITGKNFIIVEFLMEKDLINLKKRLENYYKKEERKKIILKLREMHLLRK